MNNFKSYRLKINLYKFFTFEYMMLFFFLTMILMCVMLLSAAMVKPSPVYEYITVNEMHCRYDKTLEKTIDGSGLIEIDCKMKAWE